MCLEGEEALSSGNMGSGVQGRLPNEDNKNYFKEICPVGGERESCAERRALGKRLEQVLKGRHAQETVES